MVIRLTSIALLLFVIITHNLQVAIAGSSRRVSGGRSIQMPGHISSRDGTDDIPDECKDKTYCTIKNTGFPEEQFNDMFKDMNTIKLPSLVTEMSLSSRLAPHEQDDCDTTVKFDPIYRARTNANSQWMYVIQSPDHGYVQRVRLEICNRPSAPCFNLFPPTPDTKVYCAQKYSRWVVQVLSGTKTIPLEVDLPTCCSCVYQTIETD